MIDTRPRGPARLAFAVALLVVWTSLAFLSWGAGCSRHHTPEKPNVLWIVWDTVRSDRLSLYGYPRKTTPFLDQWSKGARVFDDCLSVAGSTVPAHASWFTDLLPYEHGADNTYCLLNQDLVTLPETFKAGGYETFLYSENPLISKETGFAQGFDRVIVPWSAEFRERAAVILENKIPIRVRNPQLGARLRSPDIPPWALSACGSLGESSWLDWLKERDRRRPYLAFFNFMEAHAPVITPQTYRERIMGPQACVRSYTLDVTPAKIWQYTFGLREYSPDDLSVIGGTYDASLSEMDDLLRSLLTALEKRGELKNTIVVLTSDHGEYLGEHHLLDHQYYLYQEVLRVPLVLYYPKAVPAGRDARPVMNIDLYPTLLELAGLKAPSRDAAYSVSLLRPLDQRARLAGAPTAPEPPFAEARKVDPKFDPKPYRRSLRTIQDGAEKLIVGSDGKIELYDLEADPDEHRDLMSGSPDTVARLLASLKSILEQRKTIRRPPPRGAALSPEQKEVLRSLGYIGATD